MMTKVLERGRSFWRVVLVLAVGISVTACTSSPHGGSRDSTPTGPSPTAPSLATGSKVYLRLGGSPSWMQVDSVRGATVRATVFLAAYGTRACHEPALPFKVCLLRSPATFERRGNGLRLIGPDVELPSPDARIRPNGLRFPSLDHIQGPELWPIGTTAEVHELVNRFQRSVLAPTGVLTGFAYRCDGLSLATPGPVTVALYQVGARVASVSTGVKLHNRYAIRVLAGSYEVVAYGSGDRSKRVQVQAGGTTVAIFPNLCK